MCFDRLVVTMCLFLFVLKVGYGLGLWHFPDHICYVLELIVKYNISLTTLLQQGISEPVFYGDLVYKFKRIVGKPNCSGQFKKNQTL